MITLWKVKICCVGGMHSTVSVVIELYWLYYIIILVVLSCNSVAYCHCFRVKM